MANVVNVSVKHIRPRYNNLQEWMRAENNIYIGRRGVVFIDGQRFPREDSPFANPHKITADQSRAEVMALYEQYIRGRIIDDPTFLAQILSLRGKNLGCWCAPKLCHGDVLNQIIIEHI